MQLQKVHVGLISANNIDTTRVRGQTMLGLIGFGLLGFYFKVARICR